MRMISCDTHVIRKALRLSLNEMAVLCDIHQMSQNPKYNYWCVKSKDKMAEWLDLSRDTIFRAINTLKTKGYVISNNEGHLKCTQYIYDIDNAQEEMAIFIRNNDTELITAKMREFISSENRTQSENATIPSENQTTHSLKIRPIQSENRTLDIQETNNEKENKDINENVISLKFEFDKFRRMYKGNGVRGLDTEWKYFTKRYKNYADIVPKLVELYEKHLEYRKQKEQRREFVPPHKNFSTYVNNACWEEMYEIEMGIADNTSLPTNVTGVYLHTPSGKHWKEYIDGKKYVCQRNGNWEYNNDGTKIPFDL